MSYAGEHNPAKTLDFCRVDFFTSIGFFVSCEDSILWWVPQACLKICAELRASALFWCWDAWKWTWHLRRLVRVLLRKSWFPLRCCYALHQSISRKKKKSIVFFSNWARFQGFFNVNLKTIVWDNAFSIDRINSFVLHIKK